MNGYMIHSKEQNNFSVESNTFQNGHGKDEMLH